MSWGLVLLNLQSPRQAKATKHNPTTQSKSWLVAILFRSCKTKILQKAAGQQIYIYSTCNICYRLLLKKSHFYWLLALFVGTMLNQSICCTMIIKIKCYSTELCCTMADIWPYRRPMNSHDDSRASHRCSSIRRRPPNLKQRGVKLR